MKIIVSDLFGTLIPESLAHFQYFSGKDMKKFENESYRVIKARELIDNIFKQLSIILDAYFSEGNLLYVVSSIDGHDEPSFIFNEILTKLFMFNKKYEEQIVVFLSGVRQSYLDDLKSVATIFEENNSLVASNGNIKVHLIKSKEDVFQYLKNNNYLSLYQLYAIGNDKKDLRMLLECMGLGGKSSLISHYLYQDSDTKTSHQVMCKAASSNNRFLIREQLESEDNGFNNLSLYEQEQVIWERNLVDMQGFKTEYESFVALMKSGELDIDYLLRRQNTISIMDSYNDAITDGTPLIPVSREIVEMIETYPTFRNFLERNLNPDLITKKMTF